MSLANEDGGGAEGIRHVAGVLVDSAVYIV